VMLQNFFRQKNSWTSSWNIIEIGISWDFIHISTLIVSHAAGHLRR
jgi:hypothetical protein